MSVNLARGFSVFVGSLAVSFALATGVKACVLMSDRYDFTAYLDSLAIVRAEVLNYRLDGSWAYFDIKTVEPLVGQTGGIEVKAGMIFRKVRWLNSTFNTPSVWKDSSIIVGIEAFLDKNGTPSLQIAQQGCNPAFIMDDTARNKMIVTTQLRKFFDIMRLEQSRLYNSIGRENAAEISRIDQERKAIRVPKNLSPDIAHY